MASSLTPQRLQVLLENAHEHYRQRNENMDAWLDLYFLKTEAYFRDSDGEYIEPEPDEVQLVLPEIMNFVNTMQELLLTKHPAITVPRTTVEGEHLVQTEEIEKILYSIWYQANISEQLRDSLWFGLVQGWGVLQVVWDDQAEKDESPILVLPHDPYNVYPMPGRKPGSWAYVIHTWPRLISEIRQEFVEGRDGRSTRSVRETLEQFEDNDKVTFIDYWDDKYNAVAISYLVEGSERGDKQIATEWVKPPITHGYGFLPWRIYFPCRLPFRHIGERMGVSLFHIIADVVKYLCKLVSRKGTMLERWMDPPLVTKTVAGQDFVPTRTESGMHIRLEIEEDAKYLTHPGPPPQLNEQIELILAILERSSLPRVIYGQYVGTISGIAMSLLRNPTLMKIAFKQKAIERAAEDVDKMILKLLEKKQRGTRYLWGENNFGTDIEIQLDPKVIGGYYRNRVKLSASLPTDDASTVNMLAVLTQLKVISRKTARDVAQQALHDLISQSLVDEQLEIDAERVMENPELALAIAMRIIQEKGLPYPWLAEGMSNQQGLAEGRNPEFGDREATMPSTTLPSQTPGMPGGNTQPNMRQRISELRQRSTTIAPGGRNTAVEERINR